MGSIQYIKTNMMIKLFPVKLFSHFPPMESRKIFFNAFFLFPLLLSISSFGQAVISDSFEDCFNDGWSNTGGDDINWSCTSGSTPSGYTGPSGAFDGSDYIFIEASGTNSPNKVAYLDRTFDLSSIVNPWLTFKYHMYGQDMGSLHVDVNDGSGWDYDAWSIGGEQQMAYDDPWLTASVSLAKYKGGSNVLIRLRGISGTGYRSDISVDYFMISETPESYSDSFENCYDDDGWSNVGGDDLDWTCRTGTTPSANTGPDGASDGNNYMYTEASGSNSNKNFYLQQTFNFELMAAPEMSFDYHMYGASMGSLHVDVDDGSGWDYDVWAISGEQQADYADPWSTAIVELFSYANQSSVTIRFRGITGNGYASDISIDNVSIYNSAVSYYSDGTADVNDVNNWWSNADGTGTHPANFTDGNQKFIIQNGDDYSTTANWNFAGGSNFIEVQNGGVFRAEHIVSGDARFTLNSGATIAINDIAGITNSGASGNIQVTGLRNYNTSANYIYSRNGAQNTGDGLTGANNLTIAIDNAEAVNLSDNLTVNGTLTLTSGSFFVGANTLTLNGPAIEGIPTNLQTTDFSSLVLGGSSAGVTIPTSITRLENLTINNPNGVIMLGGITLTSVGVLNLANGVLTTGSNSITVSNTAINAVTSYSSSSFVNGTLKRALAGGVGTDGTDYVFPVGDGADYKQLDLVDIRTGVSPVVGVTVTSSPSATTGDGVTISSVKPRNWKLTTESGTLTSSTMTVLEITSFVELLASSASQAGPYSSIGGVGGGADITSSSPVSSFPVFLAIGEPVTTTYYAYQSGDWDDSAAWTLDPSGTTYYNPANAYPQADDNAVILNGWLITADADAACKELTVGFGSVLDLENHSHSFSYVHGDGTIRINKLSLPTGNMSEFVAPDGGTVEIYDVGGDIADFEFNNLIISNSTASDYTLYFDGNTQINGDLDIEKSGTGNLVVQVGHGSQVDIIVEGDVANGAGCQFVTEIASGSNRVHTLTIAGDMTDSGTIDFVNNEYGAAGNNDGNVMLTFTGMTDNSLTVNSTTRFYTTRLNKGTDRTYILNVTGSEANCNPFRGYDYYSQSSISGHFAVTVLNGTLRLGKNLNVTQLTTGSESGYMVDAEYDGGGAMWIDGATVTTNVTYFAVYGKLQVTSGTFTANNQIIFRQQCEILVEGGTLNADQIRNSAADPDPKGAYVQTGGVVNIVTGSNYGGYSSFAIQETTQAFKMSGGELNIMGATGSGGLRIYCDNYDVTGGTVNVYGNNNNFTINSTAPLYNLNMYRNNRTIEQVGRDLVVLNDLKIDGANSTVYNANGLGVTVGGDFIIKNGATYDPGNNTTTFNGNAGQEFQINGTISGNLNNLTIENTSTTVLTASAQKTVVVDGDLTINALCSLEDNGNIIHAKSDVTNSGTHSSTGGTGKLVLNGGVAQNIYGDGNGIFGNLELDNGNDAVFHADHSVTQTLTMTDGVLDIDSYRLNLYDNTTSAIDISAPSASKMIRTAGNESDKGVLKIYSPTCTSFTYPIGTASGYTPVTISPVATAYGNVTVHSVNKPHPLAFGSNNKLDRYWIVESEYFSGVSSVTSEYSYLGGDINGTEADYYAAVFSPNAWVKSNVAPFYNDAGTNTVHCVTSQIDGEYTAGEDIAFPAVVTVYYSLVDGGDWFSPATWSNDEDRSSVSTTVPNINTPVVIGGSYGGIDYNHTINVGTNGAEAGKLSINENSVLDVGVTINHYFGALPYQEIAGKGMLRISSADAVADFPAGDFSSFLGEDGGIVEYYTTGTDFTLPVTSWTTGLTMDSYNYLTLLAGGSNTITMPDLDVTVYSDLTSGGTGYYSSVYFNHSSERTLTVKNNLNLDAGHLYFFNDQKQEVVVYNDVNVDGAFWIRNGGAVCENALTIYGNLINNRAIAFRSGGRYCNITFTGKTDNVFTGSATYTILNNLTIDKGSNQSPLLLMDVTGLNTLSNDWLSIENGTFRYASPSTITVTNDGGEFTIPSTACLSVDNASSVVNIGQNNNDNSDLILNGKLEVKTGTVNVGQSAYSNNQDIIYAAAGSPEISIEDGGMLMVNGQIRYNLTSTSGALMYNQTGGDLIIWGHDDVANRAKLAVHNPGSSFNMSGGTITVKSGGGTSYSDIYIRPESSTVSGGTIVFDATAMGDQSYNIDANVPLYNLTLSGDVLNTATVDIRVNDLELQGTLDIGANTRLNSNNLDISIGIDFKQAGVYNYGTNNTVFNGTGNQHIYNTVASSFYNCTVDKTSGTLDLTGTSDPVVEDDFFLLNGTFDTKNRNLILEKNAENSATHVSTGSGSVIMQGVSLQAISGDGTGSFGNLTINNGSDVELDADIAISKQLDFQLGMFFINERLLTFTASAPDPINYNASKFIATFGVARDAGVRKLFPAGASTCYLPLGVKGTGSNKLTPVSYDAGGISGTTPYIQVIPVNSKNVATTDLADTELDYYWKVETSPSLAATSLTHTYQYLDVDVQATEASYVAGRLPYNTTTWVTTDGTVDVATNIITFTNKTEISGEYTAGYASEFLEKYRYRSRNNGNWTSHNTWEVDKGAGFVDAVAGEYPQGNPTVIQAIHTVTGNVDEIETNSLELNGILDLGTTVNHNFISLLGNGRLRIGGSASGSFVFPGGDYSEFANTENAVVEYYNNAGQTTYLPIIDTYQNVEFTGAGDKVIRFVDIDVYADLIINAGSGQLFNDDYDNDINIGGDWVNNSADPFVPGKSVVTFNGDENQFIKGTVAGETFYNVVIDNGNTVKTITDITIGNDLEINPSSAFSGTDQTISIQGDWINNSSNEFLYGTSTVVFNGFAAQTYSGSAEEHFFNIEIANSNNVVSESNTVVYNNIDFSATGAKLIMEDYRLELDAAATVSGAGASEFIQLSGSTDAEGVVKNVSGSYDFTFPVGVDDKYTPVQFAETGAGGTGTVKIVAVDLKHPFASNNITDELQYYWIVESSGLTPVNVTHTYTFDASDVLPNGAGYVAGRFVDNTWSPVFGGEAGTSVSSPTMTFTSKDYLDGEYTCGVPSNFGEIKTYYSRNNAPDIVSGADWRNLITWSTLGHSDNINIPNTLPNANAVIIKEGHKVVSYDDGISISSLTLNGELDMNATQNHDFGTLVGTGALTIDNDATNKFVLPNGNFSVFVSASGGTIKYNGKGDLPGRTVYNNLDFLGAGTINMADEDLTINGNLTIDEGQLNNGFNKDISIKGNWVDNIANGGFNTNGGFVVFDGISAQTIMSSINTKFNNLEVDNPVGVTLLSDAEVKNSIVFTEGLINTTDVNSLYLSNSNTDIVSGAGLGTSSYVNGPLTKNIPATGSFTFPVGTASRYGEVTVNDADADMWEAQYYEGDYNSDNFELPVTDVSSTEYWRIKSFTGSAQASVSLPYANSGIASRWGVVEYLAGMWDRGSGSSVSLAHGTVSSNDKSAYNVYADGNYFTVGSVNLIDWIGAVSIDWFDANNWSTASVPTIDDNVRVPDVSPNFFPVIYNSLSGGLCKSVVIEADASLTINTSYKLTVAGDWINSGTFTANTDSEVEFAGSEEQSVEGTVETTFDLLTINNTASSPNDFVTLKTNVYVDNELTLTDGIVASSDPNMLIFNEGALSGEVNPSTQSFVYGPVKKLGAGDFIFPVGDISGADTVIAPIGINNAGGAPEDVFTAQYYYSAAPWGSEQFYDVGVRKVSHIEYWDLTRVAGVSLPAVALYWYDGERSRINDLTGDDLFVAHFNGSKWENMGSSISGTLDEGSVTSVVPFTSYSPIAFGTETGTNPLPVEFLGVDADAHENNVRVMWSTASEDNCSHFEIERSVDGNTFERIGTVSGTGNSSELIEYSVLDNYPVHGINYYRIKQVDFNGEYSYSSLVWVNWQKNRSSTEYMMFIHPNPYSEQNLYLTNLGVEENIAVTVTIVDNTGRLYLSEELIVTESDTIIITEDLLTNFAPGVYFITAHSVSGVSKGKFVVVD